MRLTHIVADLVYLMKNGDHAHVVDVFKDTICYRVCPRGPHEVPIQHTVYAEHFLDEAVEMIHTYGVKS